MTSYYVQQGGWTGEGVKKGLKIVDTILYCKCIMVSLILTPAYVKSPPVKLTFTVSNVLQTSTSATTMTSCETTAGSWSVVAPVGEQKNSFHNRQELRQELVWSLTHFTPLLYKECQILSSSPNTWHTPLLLRIYFKKFQMVALTCIMSR